MARFVFFFDVSIHCVHNFVWGGGELGYLGGGGVCKILQLQHKPIVAAFLFQFLRLCHLLGE